MTQNACQYRRTTPPSIFSHADVGAPRPSPRARALAAAAAAAASAAAEKAAREEARQEREERERNQREAEARAASAAADAVARAKAKEERARVAKPRKREEAEQQRLQRDRAAKELARWNRVLMADNTARASAACPELPPRSKVSDPSASTKNEAVRTRKSSPRVTMLRETSRGKESTTPQSPRVLRGADHRVSPRVPKASPRIRRASPRIAVADGPKASPRVLRKVSHRSHSLPIDTDGIVKTSPRSKSVPRSNGDAHARVAEMHAFDLAMSDGRAPSVYVSSAYDEPSTEYDSSITEASSVFPATTGTETDTDGGWVRNTKGQGNGAGAASASTSLPNEGNAGASASTSPASKGITVPRLWEKGGTPTSTPKETPRPGSSSAPIQSCSDPISEDIRVTSHEVSGAQTSAQQVSSDQDAPVFKQDVIGKGAAIQASPADSTPPTLSASASELTHQHLKASGTGVDSRSVVVGQKGGKPEEKKTMLALPLPKLQPARRSFVRYIDNSDTPTDWADSDTPMQQSKQTEQNAQVMQYRASEHCQPSIAARHRGSWSDVPHMLAMLQELESEESPVLSSRSSSMQSSNHWGFVGPVAGAAFVTTPGGTLGDMDGRVVSPMTHGPHSGGSTATTDSDSLVASHAASASGVAKGQEPSLANAAGSIARNETRRPTLPRTDHLDCNAQARQRMAHEVAVFPCVF